MTTGKIAFQLIIVLAAIALILSAGTDMARGKIIHDAEYYILEAQNGKRWAAEDKEIDKKLAEFKEYW